MAETFKQRMTGRDLDAIDRRVAIEVLGWTEWASPMVPRGSTTPDCWQTGNRKSPTQRIAYWHPTRDIGAAMQVVEAMRGKGQHWKAVGSCIAGERYRAGFSVVGCVGDWDRTPEHHAAADTLPLAICLAALAALEAETRSADERSSASSPTDNRGTE